MSSIDLKKPSKSLEKELGYSVKEFLTTLKRQKIFLETQIFDDHIEIKLVHGKVALFFIEETERRIASMRLPLLRVRMELFSLDDEQEKHFFRQFLRAFQKGGG
ncbi:MAG: hypothetical protein DRQ61_02075 [Gammaproteobacteria bacterium]|nr:MAG: hypothetical protein DRQ56_02480 [Gammaproteobacteria bacterium]RLA24041.1 MAG: hypothetical protein DRQ61_02075 [Gammaproteobacteria bacterium]